MRTKFALHSTYSDGMVHTAVSAGKPGEELHPIGLLVQDTESWNLFGTLLLLGAESSAQTKRDVVVELSGDQGITDHIWEGYRESGDPTDEDISA